ncbi:MAG: adenylyltransferase/cytidyltransferase family protein [Selenomonadaceae bacterium]|nr:adenylyltransferase/cytidyltransferase family protein [Selenomonadaceae bacterium]
MKKYQTGYVQGTFDLFHIGHLNLFRRAKERCNYLIAGVVSDELNEVYKGAKPYAPYEERAAIVSACRYVDEVIKVDVGSDDKLKIWEKHPFDCHFCGDDHGGWEKLIEELHKRGSNVEFFPYTETTSSTRIREELKKRILYHEDDIMSFDVFDTIVTRKVATPRGIFAIMQQRLHDKSLVQGLPMRVRRNFFDMRWVYERKAREKWQHNGKEDITFEEIYKYFGEAEGLNEYQLRALMELELSVEREYLVGVDENISQLKKLLNTGHRVILISDMYFGEKEIRSLLVNIDEVFGNLSIYSSADTFKGKWSGNGYKYIRRCEGMDIFHWVHTGDNKISDIDKAKELGIKTVYYNGATLTRRESELMAKYENDVNLQLAVGELRIRRLNGENVSLDALPSIPDEQFTPFGAANRYPVGVLADKIALYGAGVLGRDLYDKIETYGKEVVCWVDKQAEKMQEQGMPVESVERLQHRDFEQVVVAVKSPEKMREISSELSSIGIGKDKIFWI